jgi:hypothetical protein
MLKPGELDLSVAAVFDEGFPHAYFKMLRAEAPVCWHPEKGGPGHWAITRYDDLKFASRNPLIYSSWLGGTTVRDMPPEHLDRSRAIMLNMDPPQHAKYRRLVQRGFTPRMINQLGPHIREVAKEIVDRIAPRGECEFVSEVAAQMPMQVICEMMGVPLEHVSKLLGHKSAVTAERHYGLGGDTALFNPLDEKDIERLNDIWKEVNGMIGRRNLGARRIQHELRRMHNCRLGLEAIRVALDRGEPAAGRRHCAHQPHSRVAGDGADLQRLAGVHAFRQQIQELALHWADQRQATIVRALLEFAEDFGARWHKVKQVIVDRDVRNIVTHVVPPRTLQRGL